MAVATKDIEVGYELPSFARVMTQGRMTLFSEMFISAIENKPPVSGSENIHTSVEYARSQGLPNTVADGPISHAWLSRWVTDFFGEGFIKGGRMQIKFIRPVFGGDVLTFKAKVIEKVAEGSAVRLVLDLVCENQQGEPVLVGRASGLVR